MDRETRRALHVWIALNRALHAIDKPLRAQVEAHGLTVKSFAVLEVLLHKGPLPIGEIGERVLLTSGSMTYVIDQLEERGLLVRRPSETDGRVQIVALTDAGKALISDVFPDHAARIDTLMHDLSMDDRETLFRLLRQLQASAETAVE